jgi:hypothetical protein
MKMSEPAADLRKAVHTRNALVKYRDDTYVSMIKVLDEQCQDILKDDLGSQFVMSCGRDLAGEVVRNFLDTSDYHITVDQLAERILKFDYENEYDPLHESEQYKKDILNYNEIVPSARIEGIVADMDKSQRKLFEKEKDEEGKPKKNAKYVDKELIQEGKDEYAEKHKNEDGTYNDGYTGDKVGDKQTKRGKRRREEVEHTQALATATYNEKYIKEKGIAELKAVYNSEANFAMMIDTANLAKGDVRVCEVDGKVEYLTSQEKAKAEREGKTVIDNTHKATPEQLADAAVSKWENANDTKKDKDGKTQKDKLIEAGYLDEDGKVPKHIKNRLRENTRQSQNAESKTILKNTKYGIVAKDAAIGTGKSLGKILAGQIIYYAAPPLVYEVRGIIRKTPSSLDEALDKLTKAGKRIGNYVVSKLKNIFKSVAFNSLKNFVKIFMDILINLVKATIKKLLKLAKNLVLATVDATKIIAQKDSTRAQKADAVCNLFGVTMTSFAVEMLFEALQQGLHIPDFLIMPLQILTTVICTNLTILILQKADLFDVRHGFKVQSIRQLFDDSRVEFNEKMLVAETLATEEIEVMIEQARTDCRQVYGELMENNPYETEARGHLDKINKMFGMDLDFNKEWLKFIDADISVAVA